MLTSRSRRRHLLGAALVTVLALTGCGTNLSPGVAVSVNGTRVSDDEVDDLVTTVCAFFEIQREESGQAGPSLAIGDLRTFVLQTLISNQLTDEAARDLELTVTEAAIVAESASIGELPAALTEGEQARLTDYVRNSSQQRLQQTAIGAHLEDDSITSVDAVDDQDMALAQDYLDDYYGKQDVDLAPSFGTWDGQALVEGTGSLSDPVSTTAVPEPTSEQEAADQVKALPPSQACG